MTDKRTIAERIRAAREALGYTQQRLAELAGFANLQTISDIERGQREVKAWELVQLARALHTDVDVLLGLRGAPEPIRVLWRRGSRGKDRRREAQLIARARRYAQLEEWCGEAVPSSLPNEQFDPATATLKSVEDLAERLRRSMDLGNIPAVSLLTTLEETYGVKIFYEPLPSETDGDSSAACARGDFGAAVLIDSSEAPWRRNFNLAHELFHLITWDAVEAAWTRDAPPGGEPDWYESLERLANRFAAVLLLPADSLLSHWNARVDNGSIRYVDVIELARKFGVSTQALLYRMVGLRYLRTEEVERVLADPEFVRLDRRSQAEHWGPPPEPLPERYLRLAYQAYEREIIGPSKLAEFLEKPLGSFELPKPGLADAAEATLTVA